MKKKIAAVLLLGAALTLSACGSSTTESISDSSTGSVETDSAAELASSQVLPESDIPYLETDEFKLSDCLELGEYKGLDLTKTVEAVTEEDIDNYLANYLTAEEVTDPDAAVEEGDTVNIAYVGTKDGVAFDGGSTDSADLVIGSDSYIDGFEDGLIGMKVGETRDLNLTFPEDYGNEELNGQAVVFSVTLNSISRAPELTDEWVIENTNNEYTSAEAYRENVNEVLQTSNEQTAEYTLQSDAWNAVQDNVTWIALPASYVRDAMAEYESSLNDSLSAYSWTMDDYLEYYNLTEEDYEANKGEYGIQSAKSRLVMEALAEKENVTKDGEEYKNELASLAEYYGMDEDTLIESYGEQTVEDYLITNILADRIISYANVTTVEE